MILNDLYQEGGQQLFPTSSGKYHITSGAKLFSMIPNAKFRHPGLLGLTKVDTWLS